MPSFLNCLLYCSVLFPCFPDRNVSVVATAMMQVGNFRVEPPGLFRGRGEHPKMGKLKRRIYPRDITINIGAVYI